MASSASGLSNSEYDRLHTFFESLQNDLIHKKTTFFNSIRVGYIKPTKDLYGMNLSSFNIYKNNENYKKADAADKLLFSYLNGDIEPPGFSHTQVLSYIKEKRRRQKEENEKKNLEFQREYILARFGSSRQHGL